MNQPNNSTDLSAEEKSFCQENGYMVRIYYSYGMRQTIITDEQWKATQNRRVLRSGQLSDGYLQIGVPLSATGGLKMAYLRWTLKYQWRPKSSYPMGRSILLNLGNIGSLPRLAISHS